MKKQILYPLVLLTSLLIITQSCKKGQDDPLISLHSRNAKIIGEWKLTKFEGSTSQTDSDPWNWNELGTTTYSFDGTSMTENFSGKKYSYYHVSKDTSWTKTYLYSYTLLINKNGTFKMTKIDKGQEYAWVSESEGTWSWQDGNKDKTQFRADMLYSLDRLSNKEIIASRNYYQKTISPYDTSWSENIVYNKYTFEKNK